MGTASLPPNLFLISSKPKFLSKMFLLFYFSVSSLNLRSRRGLKLLNSYVSQQVQIQTETLLLYMGGRYLGLLHEILPTYTMGN